jgi:protein-S-isoprenylcysteine O-methyltransferase Ste14
MKERVKTDTLLVLFMIVFTAVLYCFTGLYVHNIIWNDAMLLVGILIVLKGVALRMAARGHKKAFSQRSESLVKSGPYRIVRNPMYLGSFLIGSGFIMIVWPLWGLPIFVWLFYLRFIRQIRKEEKFLRQKFGPQYDEYCQNVDRFFPSFKHLTKYHLREILDLDEAFSTKEKRGLVGWPLLAVLLESFKDMIVFGYTDIVHTVFMVIIAFAVFGISFFVLYNIRK